MDRNSFIGLLLIFVIVTVWFSEPYQRVMYGDEAYEEMLRQDSTAQNAVSDSLSSTTETVTKTQSSSVPAFIGEEMTSPDSAEQTFLLSTPLYKIELSNIAGGTVKNFRLFNFKRSIDPNAKPVNLINKKLSYFDNLNFILKTKSGQAVDLKSYAFTPELSYDEKTIGGEDSIKIVYTALIPELETKVSKVLTFYANKYDFGITLKASDSVFNSYDIVWKSGIANTEPNFDENMAFNFVYHSNAEESDHETVSDDEILNENYAGEITWGAIRSKFFALVLSPIGSNFDNLLTTGYTKDVGEKVHQKIYGLKGTGEFSGKADFMIYFGPIKLEILESYEIGLENLMDLGWWIVKPVTLFLLWFFTFLHGYISNYGIVILVFATLIKLVLYPLTHKSFESMEKMSRLQPEIQKLKEKYPDDQAKQSQETFKLYQKHGANPLGSCLPTVLQFPILIALYNVFRSTIDLRGEPFFGWITDLSQPDTIYQLPFIIPFYGDGVNILPILMAATMFLQSSMTVVDPKQKAMIYVMPVFMLVIFNNFPSGLTWYYFLFNILSIAQQYWIKRNKPKAEAVVVK